MSQSAASKLVSPQDMTTSAKVLAFATMCLGMLIALLDIQIVSASLRDIGGGLSAGIDETVWVQTSYLIAEIIVIPLSGWLARVMSTRWLFTASAAGFTLASLLCGWAWNIQSMILFRAMQGFLGGSMIPLVFTTSFSFFSGKQRVLAAATIGGLASLAPTLGPTIGGWITDHASWHWLFYINLVPGLLIVFTIPRLINVDQPNWKLLRGADYPGMIMMALFLGCLEYTLEEGPRWGWLTDDVIATTAWISGLAAISFIWRSLTCAQPVVDLRAFKDRSFALGCFFSFMSGVGMFATIYLTPLFLGQVRGFSALDIGMAIFSTGIFQVLAIPVYSFFANRVDLRLLLMLGMASFALSMYAFTPITHDWGADQLLLPQAFRGFSQQFVVAPTVTLTLGALAPERLKLASGLFNLMRNLGGAIGIALCGTLLNNRTNLHFSRIGDHLNVSNQPMNNLLSGQSQDFINQGMDLLGAHTAALKQLSQLAYREAQTLAYGDTFTALMVAFIITALMVPLLRKPKPVAGPAPSGH